MSRSFEYTLVLVIASPGGLRARRILRRLHRPAQKHHRRVHRNRGARRDLRNLHGRHDASHRPDGASTRLSCSRRKCACAPTASATPSAAATIVSPFVVLWLAGDFAMPGVLGLMIALVVVQMVVGWAWGIESRQRVLEDVAVLRRHERDRRRISSAHHFLTYFITRFGPTSAP
jgi:hypothetical protein